MEGHTTQTLYGKRTWAGRCTSPLLFAGQYEDAESGWAYNRFRYYNPTLGAYNAQDPLGLAPGLASAQGYVDHAAFWVDVLGLAGNNEAHNAGKDWIKREVNGKEVFPQKGKHVFDTDQMRTKPLEYRSGPNDTEWTNAEAMREGGYAPLDREHNPVNLHHIGQQDDSTLVELSQRRHNECARQLLIYHGLPKEQWPRDVTPVNRPVFDKWRDDYWQTRGLDY